jgi:hypothetical protein
MIRIQKLCMSYVLIFFVRELEPVLFSFHHFFAPKLEPFPVGILFSNNPIAHMASPSESLPAAPQTDAGVDGAVEGRALGGLACGVRGGVTFRANSSNFFFLSSSNSAISRLMDSFS